VPTVAGVRSEIKDQGSKINASKIQGWAGAGHRAGSRMSAGASSCSTDAPGGTSSAPHTTASTTCGTGGGVRALRHRHPKRLPAWTWAGDEPLGLPGRITVVSSPHLSAPTPAPRTFSSPAARTRRGGVLRAAGREMCATSVTFRRRAPFEQRAGRSNFTKLWGECGVGSRTRTGAEEALCTTAPAATRARAIVAAPG